MLRISNLADYACLLMCTMAAAPDTQFCATDLALKTSLNLPVTRKVLKHLLNSGLLTSHRGTRGGYSLAHPVDQIGLIHIIEAIDGPIAMTPCCDQNAVCNKQTQCHVSSHWLSINRVVRHALEQYSLTDFTQQGAAS